MHKPITAACSASTVFRAIAHNRKSARRFARNRPIPEATLRDILECTLRTPSSFNLQPTQIVLVQNPVLQQHIADKCMLGGGNAYRTADCTALAVFLADLEPMRRVNRILELEQGQQHPAYRVIWPLQASFLTGEGHLATWLKQITTSFLSSHVQASPSIDTTATWAAKNTAMMAQSYCLAATAHGLATAIMEGYDSRRLQQVLNIPDRYSIPMVVATGYEYEESKDAENESSTTLTPRLPLEEVVFADTFGVPLTWTTDLHHQSHPAARKDEYVTTTTTDNDEANKEVTPDQEGSASAGTASQ